MRQNSDREHSSKLAVPAGSPDRCVRAESESVHRMTKRASAGSKGKSAAPLGSGALTMELSLARRMPAEWERHEATWIAWPHHEPDWPGKLAPIPWVYAEIVRVLHAAERVEILCHNDEVRSAARQHLQAHSVDANYRLHLVPNDRVWLRDSAPTVVRRDGGALALVNWRFNAWAKYDNFSRDARVGEAIERITGLDRLEPLRPDTGEPVVLEGGAIDADGAGTLLVTEECLLSTVQQR